MSSHQPRFPRSRRLDARALPPKPSEPESKPTRPETHAERAARLETLALEQRLRRLEASQRAARLAIEEELRQEHWGRLPDGWRQRPED